MEAANLKDEVTSAEVEFADFCTSTKPSVSYHLKGVDIFKYALEQFESGKYGADKNAELIHVGQVEVLLFNPLVN